MSSGRVRLAPEDQPICGPHVVWGCNHVSHRYSECLTPEFSSTWMDRTTTTSLYPQDRVKRESSTFYRNSGDVFG